MRTLCWRTPVLVILLCSAMSHVAQAQTDLHVYVLKVASACSIGSCAVDLETVSPASTGDDQDLGPIRATDGSFPAIITIALSPVNQLYGSDGSQLFSIETSCPQSICAARAIGAPASLQGDVIRGLTFDPSGTLYAGTRAGRLLKVNVKTGSVSTVHDFGAATPNLPGKFAQGFGFEGGLAFGPNGGLYASVFACPHCQYLADPGPLPDGMALMMPQFTSAKILVENAGFVALRGLVFVAVQEAGSSPILLATAEAQPAGGACAGSGTLLSFDSPPAAAHLVRCLSFQALGATANPVLPPLIASVTLRAKVSPGARQIVVVRVSPDTVTRLVVAFPNGDTLTRKQIADTSGRATFSFIQPRSKIARFSNRALVTVSVGSGQNQSSEQYPYRVLFGSMDVAVSPRETVAGSRVKVYVHTWPNRMVEIDLLYPSSRLVRLSRKTGQGGWLSARQQIEPGAVSGSRRTVAVIAFLARGPSSVSASTSFVVQQSGR